MNKKEFLKYFQPTQFHAGDDWAKNSDKKVNRRTWYENISEEEARELNRDGYGVFFTINEFHENGRRRDNFKRAIANYIDQDSPTENPLEFPVPPSIVVVSSMPVPGKFNFHYYWLHDGSEEVSAMELEAVNRSILKFAEEKYPEIKIDAKCTDCTRVFRVPGFFNEKKNKFRVKVRHPKSGEPTKYKFSTLAEAFPPIVSSPKNEPIEKFELSQVFEAATTGENFHDSLARFAMSYASRGRPKSEFKAVAGVLYELVKCRVTDEERLKEAEHRFGEEHLNECWDSAKRKASIDKISKIHGIPKLANKELEVPSIPRTIPRIFKRIIRNMCGERGSFKVDPALVLHFEMAAVSISFPHNAVIEEREGIRMRETLSEIAVAITGARKSSTAKVIALEIFSALENVYEAKRKKLIEENLEANTVIENQIKKLERKKFDLNKNWSPLDIEKRANEIKKLKEQIVEIPPKKMIFTDDATSQTFVQRLAEQGGRLSLFSGEGRSFMRNILGRYEKGEPDIDHLLNLITEDPIMKNRQRGDVSVPHPSGCVWEAVQGDDAIRYFSNMNNLHSGLIARIPPIYINSMLGKQLEGKEDKEFNKELVKELTEICVNIHFSCEKTTLFHLTDEAKELRRKFANKLQTEFSKNKGIYSNSSDFFNKAVSQAVQAAWIFASVDAGKIVDVDAKYMQWGIEYIEWRIANTIELVNNYENFIALGHAQMLINWVSDVKTHPTRAKYFKEPFNPAMLRNAIKASSIKENFWSSWAILVERGLVEEIDGKMARLLWNPLTENAE